MENNLGKAVEECWMSLYDPDTADLLETFIDPSIAEIGEWGKAASDVPLVRSISAVVNAVHSVRDIFLIKKFLLFRRNFSQGNASEKEVSRRREAAKKKEKWILDELELLIARIDNISDKRNVEILSNVYVKYLNHECTWEEFEEISQILERFIHCDSLQLKRIYDSSLQMNEIERNGAESGKVIFTMFENNHCDRLVALGLVWQKMMNVLNGGVNVEFHLTKAGTILASCL